METKSTTTPPISLDDIIRQSVVPEILDADNMWECSGCNTKVQASKLQKYKELPSRLMIHLKRFRFDPTSRRRRKLITPVLFSELLDIGKALSYSEEGTMYKLSAVLIHTGTAMGGHYKAIIRDSSKCNSWNECNDAYVKELTSFEVADLLSLSENKEVTSNLIENKSNLLRENSYMLLYQKVDDDNKDIIVTIPASIETEISKSNEEFDRMSKLFTIHKKMTELNVYFSDNTGEKQFITTFLPSTTTLQETMLEVLREIAFNPIFGDILTSTASSMLSADNLLSLCRLRDYNRQSGRSGETYDDKYLLSLAEVNIISHSQLLLEFRTEQDPVFVPFNPNELQLNLTKWEIKEDMTEGSGTTNNSIVVPGEDMATVGGLRNVAAMLYGVELDRIVLIVNNNRNVSCLNDDSKLLRLDVGIFPGDNVVIDFVPADVSPSEYISPVLAAMRTVVILYNDPASNSQDVEFNLKVNVLLSDTLYDLKSSIAEALKIKVSEFHIRRNATGPQLKGESKTLQDYSLTDQSIVFVKMGGGLQVGEHVLVFQLEPPEVEDFAAYKQVETVVTNTNSIEDTPMTPSKQTVDENIMGELGIKEKFTVLELKEQIIANWDNFKTGIQNIPESVHHLRLKDGKASSSGPLRNDRILSRCLLGMADGRKVNVQVLQKPEIIGQEDIVLSVRLCSYDTKSLSRVIDFPLNRTSTVENLYENLLDKFPHLKEDIPDTEGAKEMANISIAAIPKSSFISIAKGFSTGPPLTLKTALKLKWNDTALFQDPNLTIDIPPLNLRDGSVIVIRGVADFARAKETQRLKKIKEASEEKPVTGPVMSRPKSRAFGDAGRPLKRPEQGIIIVLPSKEGGLSPSPNKENNIEIDDLPSAPVRIVKHLKQDE